MCRIPVLAVVTIAVVASSAADACAQAFSRMIEFGDSLTDVGNTSSQTFGLSPGSNYYMGRYSNGPVWAETLATDLHLPALVKSRSGGLDYATGGSHSGVGSTSISFINLPNAGTQIESFLASNTPGANDLITLWTGANDLLDSSTLDPAVPANNVKAHVQRLISAGAKNILVINLPPLGSTPRYVNTSDSATMTARSNQFNATLSANLDSVAAASPGVTLYRADMASLFNAALTNPGAYGFTNITDPALKSDNTVVANPDQYLFWDTIHPTRVGHTVIADYTFDTVTARTIATTANSTADWNTPETWAQLRVPDATSAVGLTGTSARVVTLTGNASVRKLAVGYTGTNTGVVGVTTLQLNGGTLAVANAATIARGGTLAGNGTLASTVTVDSEGTISPGAGNDVAAVAQLNVGGDLTLSGGRIRFDLGDTTSDRVAVSGVARLNGTFGVRFVDGYIGLPGKSVALMTYASETGSPTVLNETGYAGLHLTPTIAATTLTLSLSALSGDANLDAIVNFNDLVIVAQHYNGTGLNWLMGDFTGDGVVDFNDLVGLAQNYGATSPAAFEADWSLAQSIAPEPTLGVAAVALMLGLTRRRRTP